MTDFHAGLEVVREDGLFFDADDSWVRCHPRNSFLTSSIATSTYSLVTAAVLPNYMSIASILLRYSPICPADAVCQDMILSKSILCQCENKSAFESVYNELSSCQTYVGNHK